MRDKLYPTRIGAPGSQNVHTLDGTIKPAFAHFIVSTTDRLHYSIGVIEFKSPTGTTTGAAPRMYWGANKSIFMENNGAEAEDKAFNDVVQGMVICDGPTPGTAVLLVTFGDGAPTAAQTGVYYRSLTTDTTPWTDASSAGATKLTAWQIIKAGADLYAVTDAGRCASLGDYRVSKCPAGNDPTLAASWGNGVEVGTPEHKITNLAAIGNAPVVGKPDGLYFYDTQTRQYENVLKNFELVPHALNGKVTASVTGGVVYTTHDGGAFFFDGVSVKEITPHKLWGYLGRDIGNSRITAIADNGDTLAMIQEVGHQSTQNAGIIVNTVTSALAATAITTNLIDGNMATGGDVSSLAATSFIDIWADIPFEGVTIHVTRKANGTATAVFGSVSYSSATDTFTADSAGFRDGTRLSGNGSLSYVAFPPSASAGIVMGKSPNFGSLQQKVSFNYATGTDVTLKYGMRIAMSVAAFDAETEIDELEIIPFRPGMPNNHVYTAATNWTARDRSGLVNHVLLLKRKGTNTFVPHDSYAVDAGPGVWAAAWHTGRLGQAAGGQNLGQSLWLIGRYSRIAISEGLTRDPGRTRYPIVAQPAATKPGVNIQIAHEWRGRSENEYDKYKTLKRVFLDSKYVQRADKWELFIQHDERDIITLASGAGGPIVANVQTAPFRSMNMWLAFADSVVTEEACAQFYEPIWLTYELADIDTDAQDTDFAVPALT